MGTDSQEQSQPARIAGYRVIRRLGGGIRSELYLGHADGGGTVVIKAFRADADDERLGDTVAALTRAPAGGLPGLIDLAMLPDGRTVLVLERLAGPTLPELLDRRGPITPGEAVTILAPVAVALTGLHAAGFAHTSLSLATVRFQPDGRPRLTGLGGLRRLPAAPARFDLLRADYRRLALLAGSVVDRLPTADAATRQAAALVAWFEMAATAVPFQPALEELERRLFAWSAAAPVRLEDAPRPAAIVPGRLDLGPVDAGAGESEPASPSRFRWFAARVASAAAVDRDPVRALGRRLRAVVAARRGPVTVLLCVGTAATVLALTMLPQPSTGAPRPTSPPAAPSSATAPRAAAPASPTQPAVPIGAIAGDEPVAAARALLAGREGCLAAASVVCLGAFEQPGSAVLDADSRAIGAGRPVAPAGAVGDLVQRIGDVAIVALGRAGPDSEPASLLLVKGEAGWRLREIVG